MSCKLDFSYCFLMLKFRVNIFGEKYYMDDAVHFPLRHIGRHIDDTLVSLFICSLEAY